MLMWRKSAEDRARDPALLKTLHRDTSNENPIAEFLAHRSQDEVKIIDNRL